MHFKHDSPQHLCGMEVISNATTKDELDDAVPSHILLDVSANRSRARLAHKGLMTTRNRPSENSLRGLIRKDSQDLVGYSNNSNTVCKHLHNRLLNLH